MTIVGFSFTKISGERKKPVKGKVSINNTVNIKEVVPVDLALGPKKQNGLKILFLFESAYSDGIGEVSFEGEILYVNTAEVIDKIIEQFKKDKKILKEVQGEVYNQVITKCNIQGIITSRDLALPPPIRLPRWDPEKNGK